MCCVAEGVKAVYGTGEISISIAVVLLIMTGWLGVLHSFFLPLDGCSYNVKSTEHDFPLTFG